MVELMAKLNMDSSKHEVYWNYLKNSRWLWWVKPHKPMVLSTVKSIKGMSIEYVTESNNWSSKIYSYGASNVEVEHWFLKARSSLTILEDYFTQLD